MRIRFSTRAKRAAQARELASSNFLLFPPSALSFAVGLPLAQHSQRPSQSPCCRLEEEREGADVAPPRHEERFEEHLGASGRAWERAWERWEALREPAGTLEARYAPNGIFCVGA